MQAEAVIFDIGNVLIEWQPERYYDGVIGPEQRKRVFAEANCGLAAQALLFTDNRSDNVEAAQARGW